MMKQSYRLGQYKIIENENGNLWWECYAHFATTNSGKCFVIGNILFLEPYSKISEPGYLLLEYDELLNKLPQWEKTKYYCSTYTIPARADFDTSFGHLCGRVLILERSRL